MTILKHRMRYGAALALLVPLIVAAAQEQRSGYRDADQKELRNYLLSMEKIQKLGEVEKAANDIFDADFNVRDAWNDHGIGALLTIGASVQTTDKEFPQIASAIHRAGFSTREYVVCFLTLLQAQNAVRFKKEGKSKEYPAYVNSANIKQLNDHWDEVIRLMNPPRKGRPG